MTAPRALVLTGAALVAGLCFTGCDLLRDRLADGTAPPLDPPRVTNAWVDSASVVSLRPRVAVFDVRATMPDPCYRYVGAATQVTGSRVTVEVRIRSTSEGCVTMIGRTRVPALSVRVPAPGRYTFAFERGLGRSPHERVVDVP